MNQSVIDIQGITKTYVNGNGRTASCWKEQRGLLEAEGITFRANGCVDMRKWQWKLEE